MTERSIVVRLRAEIDDFRRKMAQASTDADKLGQHALKNQEAWSTAGIALTAFGVATVAALGLSAKAAMNWESSWTGVLKTVDGSAEQLERLQGDLRQMALDMPASATEIAAVAEAAGQLGVKTEDVAAFTRVMIDLGVTTNLSATEAATALARIANIMGTASEDVSRMGAVIVDLGNNSATTEREIVDFSTRLAAAGRQAGLTEAQVFAFASTLTSVGVEAEAGGTAMSKVFTSLADAVRSGNDDLETFAQVAGVSVSEFKQAFEEDAATAIAMFVDGMGQMAASGQSTTAIFDSLQLSDRRLMRAVLSAGSAQGLLAEQLDIAAIAWDANTALVVEAEKRYATTESKIKMAKNAINDAAITIGQMLLPVLAKGAELVSALAGWFGNLPGPIQAIVVAGGGLVGILALLGGGFLLLFPRIMQVKAGLAELAISAPAASAALSRMGTVAKVATIGFGGILGVVGLVTAAMSLFGRSNGEAEARVKSFTTSLDEQTGAITDATEALVRQKLEESGALAIADKFGISLEDVTNAALGDADALLSVAEALKEVGFGGQEAINLWGSITGTTKELDAAGDSWVRVEKATGDNTDAAEDLTDAVLDYNEALTAQIDLQREAAGVVLDQREATRRFEEAIDDADSRMGEDGWIRTLDAGTEAGRENQRALDDIASSTYDLVASMDAAFASEEELQAAMGRGRAEFIRVAEQFGLTAEEAGILADSMGLIPEHISIGIDITADTATAQRDLDALSAKMKAMPVSVAMNTYLSNPVSPNAPVAPAAPTLPWWLGGRAAGGPIVGPGSSTSDSILLRGSNGEYMVDADTVSRAGGFAGMASLVQSIRGYATGGGIGVPASSRYGLQTITKGDTNVTVYETANASATANETLRLLEWARV